MKKLFIPILLLLTFFTSQKVFASTVYSQPYVGQSIQLGTDTDLNDRYYAYFPNYVSLANPPIANPVTVSSYDKIRLKIVSGTMTCSELGNSSNNILFLYTSSSTSIQPSSATNNGDYCDVTLPSSYTSIYSIFIVAENHLETTVVMDGSSFNSGKSTNGANNDDTNGGFAFQLCNSSCDEDFIENEYTTRFISIDPSFEEYVSTTTTIGAQVYINADDYEDGMYLSMSFTNQTLSLVGGSALDAFNSANNTGQEIKLPLSVGLNNVSTSTTFLSAGRTNGTWKVISPSFFGTLPIIGFLFPTNNVIATTSYFYIGYKSGLDSAVDLGGASLSEYILTGTTTGANTILNCSNLLSGGITPCITSLLIPNAVTLQNDFTRLRDGFLSVWPLGYVSRLIEIFLDTATSSIPVFSATIPNGIVGAGSTISLDLNHSIDYVLNATSYPYSATSSTFYETTSFYWNIIVYVLLGLYILRRVIGSHIIDDNPLLQNTKTKSGGVSDDTYRLKQTLYKNQFRGKNINRIDE